jgi:hypothetical protein
MVVKNTYRCSINCPDCSIDGIASTLYFNVIKLLPKQSRVICSGMPSIFRRAFGGSIKAHLQAGPCTLLVSFLEN